MPAAPRRRWAPYLAVAALITVPFVGISKALIDTREEVSAAEQETDRLSARLLQADGRSSRAEQLLSGSERALAEAQVALEGEQRKATAAGSDLVAARAEASTLRDQLATEQQELKAQRLAAAKGEEATRALDAERDRASLAERRLTGALRDVAEARDAADGLRRELADAQARQGTLSERVRTLQASLADLTTGREETTTGSIGSSETGSTQALAEIPSFLSLGLRAAPFGEPERALRPGPARLSPDAVPPSRPKRLRRDRPGLVGAESGAGSSVTRRGSSRPQRNTRAARQADPKPDGQARRPGRIADRGSRPYELPAILRPSR